MIENLLRKIFRHRDIMNLGDLYLRRFFIVPNFFGWHVFLHHIVRADKERDLHDHPWFFWTLCLRGWYIEKLPGGIRCHRFGMLKFRGAEFRHRIICVPPAGAWTLILTGPRRRSWGFHTPRGWVGWREYLGIPAHIDSTDRVAP